MCILVDILHVYIVTVTTLKNDETTSKRRRGQDLFSWEAVMARLRARSDVKDHINSTANYESAKNLEMTQILSDKNEIGEEAMVFILSSKLTTKGLLTLAKAINHVPASYSQTGYKDYSNLRLYTISAIMKKAGFAIGTNDLSRYVSLVETHCSSLCSSLDNDLNGVLWKATEEECFNCMMTPPVNQCLNCKKQLTTNNKPNKATLFTLNGPIPATKLQLRCRDCSIQYRVCHFTDKSGQHLYPKSHRPFLMEASNVSYVDKALYEWIPSLG